MNINCLNCNNLFNSKNQCYLLKCGHLLCENCIKNISGNNNFIKCFKCSFISKIDQLIKLNEYNKYETCEKHNEILNIMNKMTGEMICIKCLIEKLNIKDKGYFVCSKEGMKYKYNEIKRIIKNYTNEINKLINEKE